jgi:hypothetical protein
MAAVAITARHDGEVDNCVRVDLVSTRVSAPLANAVVATSRYDFTAI